MWRLTNTPRGCDKTPSAGICANIWPHDTALVMAKRARLNKDCRSVLERNSISSFFTSFEHAQLAALLNAPVDVTPETMEILRGGHKRADNDEPEQK